MRLRGSSHSQSPRPHNTQCGNGFRGPSKQDQPTYPCALFIYVGMHLCGPNGIEVPAQKLCGTTETSSQKNNTQTPPDQINMKLAPAPILLMMATLPLGASCLRGNNTGCSNEQFQNKKPTIRARTRTTIMTLSVRRNSNLMGDTGNNKENDEPNTMKYIRAPVSKVFAIN